MSGLGTTILTTIGQANATTSASDLLPVDYSRGFLRIVNTSTTATLYYAFDATATTSSMPILPLGNVTYETKVPGGRVSVIASTGTIDVRYEHTTKPTITG